MTAHPTGIVTFLFTDIEGSTKLAREHPRAWDAAQKQHHSILRQAIESHGGVVFQVIGDAFCAAFSRPGDALAAAHQAQRSLQEQTEPDVVVRVRMGIHSGEAEFDGDGYHGHLSMSLVQRLMSAGHGGQVLVSGATENLLRGQLPDGMTLRDMSRHNIKDVPQPVRVFQVVAPDLPTDFPPLRTIDSHPNNLPTQLTSFVGREKELADVKGLLHDTHLLTLIGPGGTGKTRLSIQAANEVLDHYLDGVWLVELAPILDPELAPRTTAIAIGLRDEPQRPVIDMLCDYLRQKKLLLILDNCEHLVDACARMTDRILHAAPDVRILASSREALGIGGEVTYRVPSLGLPDIGHLPPVDSLGQYEAVRLFIDRARSAVPSFSVTNENGPAVAQICHRLDGIPLAIELAAAKVRLLGIEHIAKRLDDRFRLLTGGSRTALERHQTLRAAIDWSYNLLPEVEQVLFRRLSVFVGGWTISAAEAVCSGMAVQQDDLLEVLGHLINKSLVVLEEKRDETRYRILETIRQYANEKLVDSGESDVSRDRHLEYFLNLAEAAEPHLIRPEQLEWLAKLDADYDNLRLALEWAIQQQPAEPSLRLCAALVRFWVIRGYWIEGGRWMANSLAKPEMSQDSSEKTLRIRARCQDAELAEYLDDLNRMKVSSGLALQMAQDDSDSRDSAIARYYVGWSLMRIGKSEEARSYAEQSLAGFREIHDTYWDACASRLLCLLDFAQGMPGIPERLVQNVELARKAGERFILASALLLYTDILFAKEQTHETRNCLREVNELSAQLGSNAFLLASVQFRLAQVEWFEGNRKRAKALLMDAQARLRLLGERLTVLSSNVNLGCLFLEDRAFDQAQAYLEEALAGARELEVNAQIAHCSQWLGILFSFQGNSDKSKQYLLDAIAITKDLDLQSLHICLQSFFILPHFQNQVVSLQILGAIHHFEKQIGYSLMPLVKRHCVQAEAQARILLGETAFESALTEGHELSLREALELAMEIVEAM